MDTLTDRQRREIEYHKDHAASVANNFRAMNYDVITSPKRRWWNAYWDIWTFLLALQLRDKSILVVGCGAGGDALQFAKLGAIVSAFDLSPDMIAHGIKLAKQNGLSVKFAVMPSEKMEYADSAFDIVFARDILHHVDILATMKEIARVSKPEALFVVDEIYSHSFTDLTRRSWLVERFLYPAMKGFIYNGEKPYITEDERKMNEFDVAHVKTYLKDFRYHKYFNLFVNRIVPDKFDILNKLDRVCLIILGRIGYFVAGRIVFAGSVHEAPQSSDWANSAQL